MSGDATSASLENISAFNKGESVVLGEPITPYQVEFITLPFQNITGYEDERIATVLRYKIEGNASEPSEGSVIVHDALDLEKEYKIYFVKIPFVIPGETRPQVVNVPIVLEVGNPFNIQSAIKGSALPLESASR